MSAIDIAALYENFKMKQYVSAISHSLVREPDFLSPRSGHRPSRSCSCFSISLLLLSSLLLVECLFQARCRAQVSAGVIPCDPHGSAAGAPVTSL